MKTNLAQRLRSWSMITLFICASQLGAQSAPVPVRFVMGTIHGFLELRSDDGRVIASGDLVQGKRPKSPSGVRAVARASMRSWLEQRKRALNDRFAGGGRCLRSGG